MKPISAAKLRVRPQYSSPESGPQDYRPNSGITRPLWFPSCSVAAPCAPPMFSESPLKPSSRLSRKWLPKDAHLMTDDSTVLKSAGRNRRHSRSTTRANEYARREGGEVITTNTVEGYFAILKRGNYGVYHHWSKKYLGQYLREFDWRYNVRKLDDSQRAVAALKMTSGKRLIFKNPVR